MFVCSTVNMFVMYMYLEGGLENPWKRTETRGKSFCKSSFNLRLMELKIGQKQGRDERTQEDYKTSVVYFCSCLVVFLHSFISALFLSFFQLHQSLSEMKFYRNFSLVYEGLGTCLQLFKQVPCSHHLAPMCRNSNWHGHEGITCMVWCFASLAECDRCCTKAPAGK